MTFTCLDALFESVPKEHVTVGPAMQPDTGPARLAPVGSLNVSLAFEALAGPAFLTLTV